MLRKLPALSSGREPVSKPYATVGGEGTNPGSEQARRDSPCMSRRLFANTILFG